MVEKFKEKIPVSSEAVRYSQSAQSTIAQQSLALTIPESYQKNVLSGA